MSIDERIKLIRGKLSQEEFGKKIGVSQSAIQLYEKGNIPKGDVLQRIYKELRVNINWLLTGNGNPYLENDGKPRPPVPLDIIKFFRDKIVEDFQSVEKNYEYYEYIRKELNISGVKKHHIEFAGLLIDEIIRETGTKIDDKLKYGIISLISMRVGLFLKIDIASYLKIQKEMEESARLLK